MKGVRQQKILEIIEKYDISTQEELIAKLEEGQRKEIRIEGRDQDQNDPGDDSNQNICCINKAIAEGFGDIGDQSPNCNGNGA